MSKIKLNYKEKIYTLEYSRSSARIIEENGFNLSAIEEQPNKEPDGKLACALLVEAYFAEFSHSILLLMDAKVVPLHS